jgi:hypothetical protein
VEYAAGFAPGIEVLVDVLASPIAVQLAQLAPCLPLEERDDGGQHGLHVRLVTQEFHVREV